MRLPIAIALEAAAAGWTAARSEWIAAVLLAAAAVLFLLILAEKGASQ